jgi:DNA-binding response OmpR family regulator
MMPEMDGWDVCKSLKKNGATASIPVIFLTAKGAEIDEVLGLELGAQDYIVKPISPRKLVARIKVALRNSGKSRVNQESEVLLFGQLEINVPNYTVNVGKQELFFPKKEFEILVHLAKHPRRVISREQLLNAIWGENVYVNDRTVDVHVRKIREKLEKYGNYIETVKGVGYRFKAEE